MEKYIIYEIHFLRVFETCSLSIRIKKYAINKTMYISKICARIINIEVLCR